MVSQIKRELEARLQRTLALSSVYNVLHWHGWRKLAPDKGHPRSDAAAQTERRKLPGTLAGIDREWAAMGPLTLMFQDEARLGRINDLRRCWAPHRLRPVCQAMLTHEYTCAYAAVDVVTGAMDSLILPYVNTGRMQVFVDEVAARHPGQRIVMVLDGAGWHRGQGLKLPSNLRLLSLPPYAPELNPVEHVWHELREKFFHDPIFDSLEALGSQLERELRDLEAIFLGCVPSFLGRG